MKEKLSALWHKIPVIIRSLVEGLAVQIIGIAPIFILLSVNSEYYNEIPWALIPGIFWLWLFWSWVKGRGWPSSTSGARAKRVRARRVDPAIRFRVYITGLLYALTLSATVLITWMLVPWPPEASMQLEVFAEVPKMTVIPLLLLASIATGFIEESAYRGYMQYPVEQRHGPIVGIIFAAIIFTISHPLPESLMPIFFITSLGWGFLAYTSNSLYPGIIYHSLIDSVFFVWGIFHVEDIKNFLSYSVLESGGSPFFWTLTGFAALLSVITIFSFVHLYGKRKAL